MSPVRQNAFQLMKKLTKYNSCAPTWQIYHGLMPTRIILTLNHNFINKQQSNSFHRISMLRTSSNYELLQLPTEINSFKASNVKMDLLDDSKRATIPPWNQLIFGKHCSDHMIEIHWNENSGWSQPHICPAHHFHLHPFAKVLHYAVEIFEGMKAYRGKDNQIRLFRPELNMKRMRASAQRICLPDFDGDELVELIKNLIKIDSRWVPPYDSKASLYIRPTMIASDETIGIAPASKVILFVATCPVGPYFATGFKPVSLLADPKHVRAWPGGSGDRKLGANYGPTLFAQREATKLGLQQVLWLFGPDHQLTEVGTMNIFVLIKDDNKQKLITPPLEDGLILPGVTRQSLIEYVRTLNTVEVIERKITMNEIKQLSAESKLLEIFGAGTACIVCPVSKILYENKMIEVPKTEFAFHLFNTLLEIQYGNQKSIDPSWIQVVC